MLHRDGPGTEESSHLLSDQEDRLWKWAGRVGEQPQQPSKFRCMSPHSDQPNTAGASSSFARQKSYGRDSPPQPLLGAPTPRGVGSLQEHRFGAVLLLPPWALALQPSHGGRCHPGGCAPRSRPYTRQRRVQSEQSDRTSLYVGKAEGAS
jgi:hypothetical protein